MSIHTSGGIMKFKIFLGLFLVFACIGCDDNKPTEPKLIQFTYPLEVGNHWEYLGLMYYDNFVFDSSGGQFNDTLVFFSSITVNRIDTLYDSVEVFILEETLLELSPGHIDTFITENYFANRDDGLYYYGYTGSISGIGGTPLKLNRTTRLSWNNHRYDSPYALYHNLTGQKELAGSSKAADFEETPIKALCYPWKAYNRWTYREAGNPFQIDKLYSGVTSVSIGPVVHRCNTVQWIYPESATPISGVDNYTTMGLVNRTFIVRDVMLQDYAMRNIAQADLFMTLEIAIDYK